MKIGLCRCPGRIAVVVQHIGVNIGAIGPGRRLGIRINVDGRKELGTTANRLEDRSAQIGIQINVASRAIGEDDVRPQVFQRFDGAYADELGVLIILNR